jgi:hypothetical protein
MLNWQPMVQLGRRARIRLPGVSESNLRSMHSKGNKSTETHTTRIHTTIPDHPHSSSRPGYMYLWVCVGVGTVPSDRPLTWGVMPARGYRSNWYAQRTPAGTPAGTLMRL